MIAYICQFSRHGIGYRIMKRLSTLLTFSYLLFSISSCGQTNTQKMVQRHDEYPYTNELAGETSPYLLQHANNPVDWYPWGEKALELAGKENKLLIISIGYAACHWCHVMEHESFEDTAVAGVMNEHFISIKVDREERPDVDQVYMNAVHLISGRGGWPLNAIALPDGRPFYAGTYFRKDDWVKVLHYFAELYQRDPGSLIEQADKVTQGIKSLDRIPMNSQAYEFSKNDLTSVFDGLVSNLDQKKGGMRQAPKFPMPSVWEYLLHYHHMTGDPAVLEAVNTTLENMAKGGIYDHIGGGFARYSTDSDWHVPHFEKMLYDNAQLVSLYSHAWQVSKDPLLKNTVYETLEFIAREMTSPEGGSYSSLDADSEGEEGKFYVWTAGEIESVLGREADIFMEYYNITESGNWEHGRNILFRSGSDTEIASSHGLSIEDLHKLIRKSKDKLLSIRDQRTRPGLDDKILASWNALMISGYAHAYRAFGEEKFLAAALRNADFLLQFAMNGDNGINRNYKDGRSTIPGFLDDYAFLITAFTDLYQVTFDEHWLERARTLTEYTVENFFDSNSGMFFYTHAEHASLIARNMETSDNVIPASNSEMARNLYRLGHYFYNDDYLEKARQMLRNVVDNVHQNIFYFSNWGILESCFIQEMDEVAILGDSSIAFRQSLDDHYLPFVLYSGGTGSGSLELLKDKLVPGQTTIYVCREKTCKLPVRNISEAMDQLKH